MKIDLTELLKNKNSEKHIHLELDEMEIFDGRETVKVLKPIIVDGTLHIMGDIIALNCSLESRIEFSCSRCLEQFQRNFTFNISEQLSKHNCENKDEDIIFIDSDIFDITEILVNNIIVNLPLERLCHEDCKGLCQQCGNNLNLSTCKCKEDDVDPRLEKLKGIFFTD